MSRVGLDGSESLSDQTHLYRHFDSHGRLLYVGISLCAVSRLRQHKDSARWFDRIKRVEIETFGTREDALEAERIAIKKEGPEYNIAGRVRTSKVIRQSSTFLTGINFKKNAFYRAFNPYEPFCFCNESDREDAERELIKNGEQECDAYIESLLVLTQWQVIYTVFNRDVIAANGFCDLCGGAYTLQDIRSNLMLDLPPNLDRLYFYLCDAPLAEDLNDFWSMFKQYPSRGKLSFYFNSGFFQQSDFIKWDRMPVPRFAA